MRNPKPIDWRKEPDAPDQDDELMDETPEDIVFVLGFDPLDFATEGDGKA